MMEPNLTLIGGGAKLELAPGAVFSRYATALLPILIHFSRTAAYKL